MAATAGKRTVETLLELGDWEAARRRIEPELEKRPDSHWLLTQLGVTYYEQGRYADALRPLLDSLDIVPDCPLTLWNTAGTLDALGKPTEALAIYLWLLASDKSPADDDCWESEEWTLSLKTDCMFRTGLCLEHVGGASNKASAETCCRQYINLLLEGMNGMSSVEEAAARIRELHGSDKRRRSRTVKAGIGSALQDKGILAISADRRTPPVLSRAELLGA